MAFNGETGTVVATFIYEKQDSVNEKTYISLVLREIGTRTKVEEQHTKDKNGNQVVVRRVFWDEIQTKELAIEQLSSWCEYQELRGYTLIAQEGAL